MTTPRLAAIVHGARWPAWDAGAAWRERLSRALQREVEIVLARDEVTAPRGAAACIMQGLGRTLAPHVIVADVHATPDDDALRAIVAALDTAMLVLPAGRVADPEAEAALRDRLLSAAAGDTNHIDADPAVWAVHREAVLDAGGLDETLWSIGVVDDIAARLARADTPITRLGLPAIGVSDVSYPYASPFATFLSWRNRLRLAFAHASSEDLGRRISTALVSLLAEAWAATGLDAANVSFGGDWGRASLATRLRTRFGGPPPDTLWPRDETGTAVRLAALHAFALELPDLLRVREARGLARDACVPQPTPARAVADSGLPVTRPRVSVIVVNWNGRDHLEACLASLRASDYPADLLELICVDNGSVDDSRTLIAERFPEVRVVALPENRGFTGGNAAGVAAATGDVFVFVNNDMKFEPTLVSRLIDGLDDATACTGARVMSWDGSSIDFVRGTSSFEARGFQEQFGQTYTPGMALAESFFPNGGAFAVTRRAYEDAGGFDPALFAYYDDVDLGWRLRMAGHGIHTVAEAVAYHRHGATVGTQPHAHKRFVLARNALWIAIRNYDDRTLPHVLPAVLMLAGLRVAQDLVWLRSPLSDLLRPWLERHRRHAPSAGIYDVSPTPGRAGAPRVLAGVPMPEWAAIGATLQDLPRLLALHDAQQQRRRVPDDQVLPFLGRPFEELDGRKSYRAAQKALVEALGLRARLGIRPHVLLLTHESLRINMSGPAIRVLEMARALSRTARVTVCAPAPLEVRDDRVALVPFDPARPAALKAQAETADALIVQGFALTSYPFLSELVCPIVADLYCPFTIEHLEQHRAAGALVPSSHESDAASILAVQNAQLQQADYFICASERQRDFWIGTLHTAGRVNPRTLARDPDLRSLIDVVPFGLPSEPVALAADRARESRLRRGLPAGVMKGVHPGVRSTDRVLLWGGSLLDWQDPETLIAAVSQLARTRDDVKLFFMGVKHPNPQVAPMAVVERSRRLAESLGVAGSYVIFNDWVPYDERALYLMEADLGVSTHHAHLETRYAFRTRMLDYLWARLPIVCTEGDHFGDLVRARGLGRAVPPGDPDALAVAIAEMLDAEPMRRTARETLGTVADAMTWDRVVEPLRQWCADPMFAADREHEVVAFRAHLSESFKASRWLKRTALRLGVKEGDVEAMKRWGPVRAGMSVRNAVAIRRARRKARAK
ncbi:N-acetylglucosaminyl-diphospho-decaprenol L-rhamnosyltransferase [Luteitalea pratensis]|uniref:N-acetylglucosaminyl-diphospho-decaprenol L-rhamnosyltransferase n=1 Tax=Luteitalea pratensis TaxID=1855912 RepID=A0A143PVE1_LUTPR|nr:glycosyltransferase [Luteitalea pratensis]AMY11759.1 N-acetylglucosaminyl-diphospho-decaprenol L-rhamnosyltransferase [Luteitalea pratensis]